MRTIESTRSFHTLELDASIMQTLKQQEFHIPTPVQSEAIPLVLSGRDVLASAQTGSGKTAAFALPIIHQITAEPRKPQPGRPKALVLAPTRELAGQIAEVFELFSRNLKVSTAVIFGGVGKGAQVTAMRRGVDVVVATPGRLLDLMQEGVISLDHVQTVVLDEADRMLDMGFIPDVRRVIAKLPAQRQSLFFSATLPPQVVELSRALLTDPARIAVETNETTRPQIDQGVMFVNREDKRDALRTLLTEKGSYRALVFTRTKHRARDLAKYLNKAGITADDLQGNKSQNARIRALAGFHSGDIQVLVATDIASRGIDVDDIDHVINFELPNEPESYVHRIGRTARAGKTGIAVSFCDESEIEHLAEIERAIEQSVPVITNHRYHAQVVADAALAYTSRRNGGSQRSAPATRGARRPGIRSDNRTGESGRSGERSPSQRSRRRRRSSGGR